MTWPREFTTLTERYRLRPFAPLREIGSQSPSSVPSSLYANAPTESSAAERQPTYGAATRKRPVLVLDYLVVETFCLLTGTGCFQNRHYCTPL
jgi:hypothetical protein